MCSSNIFGSAKIPYFCQSFNRSDSIFLAARNSENLNFVIFRIQHNIRFILQISLNKAISVVSQK